MALPTTPVPRTAAGRGFPGVGLYATWGLAALSLAYYAWLLLDLLLNPAAPGIGMYGSIVAIVVSATLLILRYRAAQPREREQIKWFLWVGIVCGVTGIVFTVFQIVYPNSSLLTSPVGQAISFFFNGAILAFPATAISVAILRNRLWDIDVLINRTLVYGTLTVLLAGLYFGLIFGLQFALQGILPRNNDIVTVISTLATASLFQPLRRRIQQRIDRRFYRHKYDATRTLEAFSAALRSEVDLVQLDEHLRAVVQETMQPAQVRLWLRPASHEKAPTA